MVQATKLMVIILCNNRWRLLLAGVATLFISTGCSTTPPPVAEAPTAQTVPTEPVLEEFQLVENPRLALFRKRLQEKHAVSPQAEKRPLVLAKTDADRMKGHDLLLAEAKLQRGAPRGSGAGEGRPGAAESGQDRVAMAAGTEEKRGGEKETFGQDRVVMSNDDAQEIAERLAKGANKKTEQTSGQDRVVMSNDDAQKIAERQARDAGKQVEQATGQDRVVMSNDEAQKMESKREDLPKPKIENPVAGQDRVIMPAAEAEKIAGAVSGGGAGGTETGAAGLDRIAVTGLVSPEMRAATKPMELPTANFRPDEAVVEAAKKKAVVPMAGAGVVAAALEWDAFFRQIAVGQLKLADGKKKFKALHTQLQKAGRDYRESAGRIFPLLGYSAKTIVKQKGWVKGEGYRFFKETDTNHAAIDLYIADSDSDGLDDKSSQAVPVAAFTGGVVVAAYGGDAVDEGSSRHGNYVWIYHPPTQRYILYANLSEVRVTIGQLVAAGDVVGLLGRTGWEHFRLKDRTHLHLMAISYKSGLTIANPWSELKKAKEKAIPEGFDW